MLQACIAAVYLGLLLDTVADHFLQMLFFGAAFCGLAFIAALLVTGAAATTKAVK